MATDKALRFRYLQYRISKCEKCVLHETSQALPCIGNPKADIMFIGDKPNAEDIRNGEAFSSKSWQKFKSMIIDAGINMEDVFMTNVISCYPYERNKEFFNKKEGLECVNACKTWVYQQMLFVKPKIIVGVGGFAHKHIAQMDEEITKSCGNWERYIFSLYNVDAVVREYKAWYLPMLNPDFCFKGNGSGSKNNKVMSMSSEEKTELLISHINLIPEKLEKVRRNK